MSNFTIFQPDQLTRMIEPFAPGMAPHITPIKYEAITPDIFAFLFRTTDTEGVEHFFVTLEYDYLDSLQAGLDLIDRWHGRIIELWLPNSLSEELPEEEFKGYNIRVDSIYMSLFAEVDRPRGRGYWATNTTVYEGDDITEALTAFPEKEHKSIIKEIDTIRKQNPHAAISIFVNEQGTVDFFYQ